jgi:hypothetical protein
MAAKKGKKAQKPRKQKTTRDSAGLRRSDLPELPLRPGTDPNRVDVTGTMPEGIRVDPDLTEGHPGYEESGDSEIIPNKRLTKRGPRQ